MTNDPRLEAVLAEEADFHIRYAELCRSVGSSLTSESRRKDMQSRAEALLRSTKSIGAALPPAPRSAANDLA